MDAPSGEISVAFQIFDNERLQSGLEELSDDDLELLTLYVYAGYNTVELSKVYGIAQQNISKRIFKITKFLKKF